MDAGRAMTVTQERHWLVPFKVVAILPRKFRASRRSALSVAPELALGARGYPGPTDSIKGRARCACDRRVSLDRHEQCCVRRSPPWRLCWTADGVVAQMAL